MENEKCEIRVVLSSEVRTVYQPAAHPCFIRHITGSNHFQPLQLHPPLLPSCPLCVWGYPGGQLGITELLKINMTRQKALSLFLFRFSSASLYSPNQHIYSSYLAPALMSPPRAFGAIRMAGGWIESIWIGFRLLFLESFGLVWCANRRDLTCWPFIWPSSKAANIRRGKTGPDVDYARLEHLDLRISRPHWSVELSSRRYPRCEAIMNMSDVVYFLTCSPDNLIEFVPVFVATQEEQARLWDVPLRQVPPLHLWPTLQRWLSTEPEGLLCLHVQR